MPDLAGQRTIKRFRVAREGQTVDGRAISRQHILEMANTYNPVEYTARINVEHSSGWGGLSSDNYPILGDVIAVDAQLDEYTINGVKVQLMGYTPHFRLCLSLLKPINKAKNYSLVSNFIRNLLIPIKLI